MAPSEEMAIGAACETAPGGRTYNEDRCYAQVLDPTQSLWGFRGVLIVADGMGGHVKGEQAAQIALDAAVEVLTARLADHWNFASSFSSAEPRDVLRGVFERANQRIYEWAVTQDVTGDTGTTLTVVVCTAEELLIGNVGDSRAYLVSGEDIRKLTEDHSWVGEQVRLGRLTEEEAAQSPLRNQLTQAVGVDPSVHPHMVTLPLEPGRVAVACTDGLTEAVDAEALAEVVYAGSTPEDICRALVALAVAAGTTDNVTVAALSMGPPPVAATAPITAPQPLREPEPPPEPEVRTRIELEDEAPTADRSDEGEAEEPVVVRGGERTMARQRNQRLGTLLIVSVVSLLLGLLVGHATVGTRQEQAPTPAAATPPTGAPVPRGTATSSASEAPTAEAGRVVVGVKCEGHELAVTPSEDVTLDVYPKGKYSDPSARLLPIEGGEAGATRYRLAAAPPASWQTAAVTVTIARLGGGRLKITMSPEAEAFVDNKPHAGDDLLDIKPEGTRCRIGFYFPSGDDPNAYAIAIVGFPVAEG
jgi:serine/threonine protein phosphatase PrpC